MAETLGQAVLEVGVDDSRLRAGLQGVERQAAAAGEAVSRRFTASGREILTANNGLEYFIDANGRARRENGRFVTATERAAAGIDGVGRSAGTAGAKFEGLGGAVRAVGGALATIGAVAIFQDLIRSATEAESITRKLSNTLGDQGAQQAIGFLRELSDRLGLSFNVLADSFGGFTAAASAANIPLQEQKDLFAAVATSGQRLGLTNDAISGSLIALQQIASKGVVSQEELRQQLGERLPIATAAAAIGLGVTSQELIKLVESGRLTAEQFFPAITKGLNELNGNGTGTVPTATQNFAAFGNELEKLKAQVGTEFLPGVVAGVQELAKALGGLNVQIQANKLGFGQGLLGNLFGVVSAEGAQAVGTLQQLANTYGLSQQQARALFTDAVKDVGATTNAFGQLNLSAEQYETILAQLPGRAAAFTKEGREAAAFAQRKLEDDRRANAESQKQLNTQDKINARLKEARKQLGGLDIGSSAAEALRAEIDRLQALTPEGAGKAKKAVEAAANESKRIADNFQKAADAAKSASQSFAETVAGSRFASESAQRQARDTLERRATETLNSGAVNRDAVAREFGLPISQAGSLSIEGGGQSFQRSFTNQVSPLDLRGLGLDRLSELVQQTAPLADGAKSVQESNKELAAALKDLKTGIDTSNQRESNLTITVPVGGQKQILLP
jgi:tape measure domain-containing protein